MREWSGVQKLVRPVPAATLDGFFWVDTFDRAEQTVVWAAVVDISGVRAEDFPKDFDGDFRALDASKIPPVQDIHLLGGFRSAAKARTVADTVLAIVRPDWPGVPVHQSLLDCEDVFATLQEVGREADSSPHGSKCLGPLRREELEALTHKIEHLRDSVHDWRLMMVRNRNKTTLPALVRMKDFKVVAAIPFLDGMLERERLDVEIDGKLETLLNVPACRDSAFMNEEHFIAMERILRHCDLRLSERYGAQPSGHLMVSHLRENAAEMRRMATFNLFGMSIVGRA